MSTPTFRFQKDAPRLSLCLSSSASQGLSDDKLFQEESPKYGEQTEIHTYFIWSRRISFIFHLYSKKHRRMEDRWMAKLELLQTPHKHLHHSVPLGNISRALWDRSQGNLSRYSGKGTEVVNSEKQPNHPLKYSSLLQHKNSQAVLCALCSNQTAFTPTHGPDILIPCLSSLYCPFSPNQSISFLQ